MSTPNVLLRFFGRFVFVEPSIGSVVHVVAVDPQYNPDVDGAAHQFLMTVPRSNVRAGSRPPTRRVMAGLYTQCKNTQYDEVQHCADLGNAEHYVWDLGGLDLTIDGPGRNSFCWTNCEKPIDLTTLCDQPRMNEAHLYAGALASGVVHLSIGQANAYQLTPGSQSDLVCLKDAPSFEPGEDGGRCLPDVVEVALDVPAPLIVRLSSRSTPRGTSAIAISDTADGPAVVSFSNLCAELGPNYDHEFAAFYELLVAPPITRDRRIPIPRRTGGSEFDCFTPARLTLL